MKLKVDKYHVFRGKMKNKYEGILKQYKILGLRCNNTYLLYNDIK